MFKKYLITFILVYLYIIILTLFGFYIIVTWKGAGAVIFMVLLFTSALAGAGVIGPKSWKNFFRGYINWLATKTRLFFPASPVKPVDESLKQGVKDFLPTKERVKNWLIFKVIGISLFIIWLFLFYRLYKFFIK